MAAKIDTRDYFAAKIIQGLLTRDFELTDEQLVALAYGFAEKMIEYRIDNQHDKDGDFWTDYDLQED